MSSREWRRLRDHRAAAELPELAFGRRADFKTTCVPGKFPGFGMPVIDLAGPEASVEVTPYDDYGDLCRTGVVQSDGRGLGAAAGGPRIVDQKGCRMVR
jgi:hypothetical protein